MGMGAFIGTTIAGKLIGITGNYSAAFCFAGLCLIVSGFLKLLLPLLIKCRNRMAQWGIGLLELQYLLVLLLGTWDCLTTNSLGIFMTFFYWSSFQILSKCLYIHVIVNWPMSLTITSSLLQIYFQYNFNSSEFHLINWGNSRPQYFSSCCLWVTANEVTAPKAEMHFSRSTPIAPLSVQNSDD